MGKFLSVIRGWLIYATGAIAAYGHELTGIVLLFLFFFVLDFFTGFFASLRQGKGFRSSKARWSFVKSSCYFGTFATIAFMGLALNEMELFMGILKVAVYSGAWFECVSNLENLMILFPGNRYLRFLHYILAVEWVKKIPGLSDFLKEEKRKGGDGDG
ncbi:MAG: phage holin family protein [Tannerella sp.]|jgi:hypothetical protein|nr:phage holin family protein [Tannerella sp.]